MEIEGIIKQVLPTESGESKAGNPWKKQTIILDTEGQYPKEIAIEIWGDSIEKFALAVGDKVKASIDVESREFNGRWYTGVKAFAVSQLGKSRVLAGNLTPLDTEEDDTLPF